MVTRPYFAHQEQSYRRSSCRGPSDYHTHDGRYLSHNERAMSRSFAVPSQESRHNDQDSDKASGNQQPRRRIAVACGRCRKRKIRCSGDKGSGNGCDNCKNAGNDSCQFLRVQSDECSLYTTPAEFPYSEDTRSSQCRLMPSSYNTYYGNGQAQYPQVVNSMAHGATPYRTTSVSNFQWPGQHSGKSMYSIPLGSEFGDEGVDYSPQLQGASYRMSSQEHLSIPSNAQPQTNQRLWNSGANALKNSTSGMSAGLYGDELATPFQPAQLTTSYGTQSFPLRPAPHVDSGNFSLRNLASSLPNASPINDRLLPVPAVARQSSQANSSSFIRAESMLPVTSSYQHNCEGITNQEEPPIHSTDNDTANSSLGANHMLSYMPLSSSPDTSSQSSSHIAYSSPGHLTSSQSHQSLYNSANDGLYPMAMPSEQPAYQYGRDSVSGRNSIDGTLSSGHIYRRPPHGDPNVVSNVVPVYQRRSSTSHEVMAHRSSSTNDLRA